MKVISKQLVCQKFIFKIHSSRLRKERGKLNLPLDEARRNDEIIALADSQVLRWIDEINGITDADEQAKEIKTQIRKIKKEENSRQNTRKIRELYTKLDDLQFKPDYMCLIIDKNKDYYRACNGFSINGVKYKRLLGTNGGIKNSTIVFVSENVSDELHKRIENGRDPTKELVTAKLEAYKALACSASIPVSMPSGVLVVDDARTEFMSDITFLTDENVYEPTVEFRPNQKIELDASDGFGLMLPSLAEKWSEELGLDYVVSGLNTRNAFEKGMLFTFDFIDFADKIANNYIVKDAWGNDVDIRNIEVVLTTSMLKLWDSYESCEHYLKCCEDNHYTFCVTKTCPEKLENERTLNYQFIQPYDLSDEDIGELITPTIDEIKDILSDDWRKTAIYLKGSGLNENNAEYMSDDYTKAIMIDKRILNDPYVKNSIYQLIKNRINEAKVGVLKVHGNYSIASGDPYALCQSMFGMEITGLLKAGEIYNGYWKNNDTDTLACFRAPMSTYENIRKVKIAKSDDILYWYQYMRTCTIFNAWDTSMAALNGMDFDGDMVMLTDNPVLVNHLTEKLALVCAQRRATKCVPTEEDFIKSNIQSFGSEIGQTTNYITSMYEVRSGFDKDSEQYEMLSYRIRCGEQFQQNAIDKSKGIICKPMPKEWHNRHSVNQMEDSDTKDLYRRIVADKKPYFMRYIYPQLMKEYNTYIKNTNKNALREFQLTVDELKQIPKNSLTDRQSDFLKYYEYRMPVGTNDCLMNKICRRFEEEFDGYISKNTNVDDFDYTIMKSEAEYTPKQFSAIKKLYEEYNKKIKSYAIFANYERIDITESKNNLLVMNNEFKKECEKICPNSEALCNIILDICYNKRSTKKFAWDMCGSQIINNLLKKNKNQITIPVLDDNGDIEFGGNRYKTITKEIGVNEQ